MPGLAPPAGPAFAPAPPAPARPRRAPDRTVPPLDGLVAVRGYPALTDQAKRTRLHGIDVEAKKAELGGPS
jgi:hypothetical protein